ncbi:hypothetical protein [Bradyrhizobium sp. SYSU BS000235]|uniref:hypothetical protein n=1 Tax=Bradyrhizobium sp. SYSU BS000235 TaxID=3411332 RepID=UPI003C753D48
MKTLCAAILFAALLFQVDAVRAAPLAPLSISTGSFSIDGVIVVKDGCGVGFERVPGGACRPQPKGPALMRIFARKCPLGYRRNWLGKCRRE